MPLPNRPTILHFQPYPSRARVCTAPYTSRNAPDQHLDTEVQIDRVDPFMTIEQRTLGYGVVNFTLGGLALFEGVAYRCRVQHKNSVGWSGWSLSFAAAVPTVLSLPEVQVPTEPVPGAPLTVPIAPSHVADVGSGRAFTEWLTETGDTIRRLQGTRGRRSSPMLWENLTTAEKDTLVAFLEARADAVEGFQTSDPAHGTRTWFVRRGRIELIHVAPQVWSVQVDADEIFRKRFFTVGVSQIAGPDEIR